MTSCGETESEKWAREMEIDVGSVVCQTEREHKDSKNYSKYFPSAISTASFLDHDFETPTNASTACMFG